MSYDMMKHMSRALGIALTGLFLLPTTASAVELSLDPATGAYGPGETFMTTIRLDPTSQDECINAVDLSIAFPRDTIKISAITTGESILSLWAQEPQFSQEGGTIHIIGGIPGGYCGRVMGDPGRTDIVAKIVWSIPGFQIGTSTPIGTTTVPIHFTNDSKVLLNDGRGSEAPLSFTNASYTRIPEARTLSSAWLDEIKNDTSPPEPFTAQIVRDPNMYQGKYVLVWGTVDKQSGISHFEVTEEDPGALGYVRGKHTPAVAVRATSPHVLVDQELKSRITVRAYDEAGNRRDAVIERGAKAYDRAIAINAYADPVLIVVGLTILAGVFVWTLILKRRRISNGSNDPPFSDEAIP